jgi:hypothetical protein
MREGVIICRPPEATAKWQSSVALVLSHNGYSCQLRQRFDGVLIVAFGRDKGQPDSTEEELTELLTEGGVFLESTEIKLTQ